MITQYTVVGGMKIGKGNQKHLQKILRDLTQNHTRAAAVESR
jgi:hypothetical protein